jgi:large repetitive protein
MRRLLTLLFFVSSYSLVLSQAQEICNNGIDDDFDGFIDCYDGSCANSPLCDGIFLGNDAACESPPPSFPAFTMSLDFASPNETTNHLSRMAVGDLDRDGVPEMVTMNRYTKKLFILNGNNGSIKAETTVTWEPYWEIAIANLDNDACGEIFFIGYQNLSGSTNDGIYIFAYDCQLNLLWTTAKKLPGDPINFGIADFDGDGKEEIYAKDEIYDAKTGTRIVKSTASTYTRINGGPVAVNMLGDSKLELVIGLNIYQVNLGNRNTDVGSLTLLQGRNDYFIRGEYNATSVADYNLDGKLDVLASGSTGSHGNNTTVFFWDVQADTIKTYNDFQPALGSDYTKGWVNGTGRLNIADLDGNGKMNASFVSGRFLYALDEKFNLLWRVNINEETSGHTGCTLFDFNGDGKAEIVYRDERFLYIIEGTDGSVYSQQACISRTNREYPIVADVDGDGSTELCVTCGFSDTDAAANFNTLSYSRYSHIRVFKSAAEPWVPARRVWNQHGYFVVNVNDDLTIPTALQQHQLIFSTGNCTQGPNRPLNKFLNQAPYLNSEGCPTYASADIAFLVDPTIIPPTCPDLNFTVSFQITNLGDVAVTGNIPVTFYTTNPKRAGAVKLNTINATVNQLGKGDIVIVNNAVVTGNGSDSLYVVLNDAGTSMPSPIVLPNTNFIECNYDNIKAVRVNPLPATITALKVADNEICSAANSGVARAFVPMSGGGENTADYNFYWSDGTVAKPVASADFVGAIYSGIPAGTYTVYARHKTANCNSDTTQVVIGQTTTNFPAMSVNVLSNQTSCVPLNGKLELVITGGGGGYSIDWFDIGLNSLGISGPIADNLPAGQYVAVVSRGPCSTSTAPATITAPLIPDAQASVVSNVLDCSNPNSGSVTAAALVNGQVQNPSNFTFTWVEYDNLTNTPGQTIPTGPGPLRTGLPVGFYQVQVKDNASQCASTIKPIVQITSATVIPDAPQIVIVSPQTSCDPLHPNGVMTANVFIGGVQQNPADFTFEWFKGQNTLPANLVSTVSDVNGKTVNQVAGGGIPYTVKVTNALHCSSTSDRTITENIITPVVTLSQLTPNSICDPAKASVPYNGSVKATVTFNGNPVTLPDNNYEFTWTDPSGSPIVVSNNHNPILTGLPAGNPYTVTVKRTDLFCMSTPDTEPVLNAIVLPQLNTASTGSNTCDPLLTPDGTASVTVTNALPGQTFTFQWYSGSSVTVGNELSLANNNANQATAIKLGGPAGSPNPYTVLVLNTTTGCQNSATQFVSDESVVPVISFLNVTPNTICSPSTSFNGSLEAKIDNQIGAITDYVFTWYNGNSNTAGNENTSSTAKLLSTLGVGFYTVETMNTITGCKSTAITNQVPDGRIIPAISISSTGSNNCDASLTPDGTITATVTNGGTNFSYAWSAVAPASAITNAANNANQAMAIHVGGTSNAPNSYQVLVINTDTGCQNTGTGQVADVSVKPTLTLQSTPNAICSLVAGGPASFNGQLQVTAVNHPHLGASTTSFEWFNADPVSGAVLGPNNNSTTAILNQLDNGKFGVRVTVDALGCTSDIVVDEVQDDVIPLVITTNIVPSTNCAPVAPNGLAEVTSPIGANIRYQWYDGLAINPANIKAGKTNAILGNDIQGAAGLNFTVLVTDLNTGCQNNKGVAVTDGHITPTLALSVIQHNTICLPSITPDGALLATVGSAGTNFTINWIGGDANALVAGATGEQFTHLKAGAYSATVIDNLTGCQSTSDNESILDQLTHPDIQQVVIDQTSCDVTVPNGSIQATDGGVTANRNFEWFTGVGTLTPKAVDAGDPSNLIDDLTSGDYTIRVTIIPTGCSSVETHFVPEAITLPQITFTAIGPVTRCDNPDGSVTPSVVDASTNFTISYVFTDADGTPPVTSAAVTGAPTIPVRADLSPYTGLDPGFVTAVVINNTTHCTSNPFTGVIVNTTDNYNIGISGTAAATGCGLPNGGININVVGGSGNYDYDWKLGTPTNQDINFFNNPPVIPGPTLATTQDIGTFVGDPTKVSGTYTVVVTDQANGCGNYFVSNIPFANPPTVNITPTPNSTCAAPNGEIDVTITPGIVNVTGYSTIFYTGTQPIPANKIAGVGEICFDGIDNDGDGFIDGADPDCGALTFNINGRADGDYYVEVYDNDVLNRPCPLGFQVHLLKTVKNPLITVDALTGNTSCDPATSGDGSVALQVDKAPGDLSVAQSYHIENVSPLPIGFVLNASPGNLIGTGSSGQSTGTMNGFRPQAYTFRVRDNISKCFSDLTVNVPDQQALPSALAVTPTPETACAPGSNGSALASLTGGEPVTEFNFNWFNNSNGTGSVIPAPAAGGGATTGELLNQSKIAVPADWAIGTTGFGSGNRTYFVRAVRNPGTGSGVGCATTLQQVVIPDAHVSPNLQLTAIANSFCGAVNPGAIGDGSISITADANPNLAGNQNSTGGFNYSWTNPNAILTTPQLAKPNVFAIPQLGNGSFQVTATNIDNGCLTTNTISVVPAPFFININNVIVADQLICNPNGQIDVTQIVIDRSAASLANVTQTSTLPLTSVYDFQWFAADPADANVIANPALVDVPGPTPINAQSLVTGSGVGQFANMGAGSYYVIATRKVGSGLAEGCSSFPVRVDVEDHHKNPVISLTPLSNTSCLLGPGTGEGEIIIHVSDATSISFGPVFSFDYDWTSGGIADAPGNDGDGDASDGDKDHEIDLLTGVYALTVTNPTSGCSSNATTEILINSTPVFVQDVTPLNQISCHPNGDGSLNVVTITINDRAGNPQVINSGSSISDFEFDWTRDAIAFTQTTPGTLLDVGTYDAVGFGTPIGAGNYTVIARRMSGGPGVGCASEPFQVTIQDQRILPVASLLPAANTACDPAFSEGSIQVNVSDATTFPGPHTFTYVWDNVNNPTSIPTAAPGANNGNGLSTDGDEDNPSALLHGTYGILIRNNQSLCESTSTTVIFQNATPIIIPQATPTPQIICLADGAVEVDVVNVTDRNGVTSAAPFGDFEFTWSRGTLANVVATTPGSLGQVAGGTILNRTVYNQIGVGDYFIVARRISGNVGRGCTSAPYHTAILDERLFPEVVFSEVPNSSCNPTLPNGILQADAREPGGVNTGPYTFTWLLNSGAVSGATTQNDTNNSSRLTSASDGSYEVRATNTITGCPVLQTVALVLDQALTTPNIIDVTTVDPVDCNPTGSATVTKITLGSTTHSVLFPPNTPPNNEISGAGLNNFDYEWYAGSVTSANQLPIGGPPFTTTASIGSLLTGTYFVIVHDPTTDCRSGMKEVVIRPDNIVYPVLSISQTSKQVSCIANIGTAGLRARADGQTDSDPNYSFTWFANSTNTAPSFASTSAITNILAGSYSITVRDNTTNCTTSDNYLVEDDTQAFVPVISTGSQPRTLCVGTDGELVARVINLDPTYPYTYNATTFTADLYVSGSPNLNAAPDFPSIPLVNGFITNFSLSNLNEGPYTVRIRDNNTGCVGTAVEVISDDRLFPVVAFSEIAPVTNCDPARPNGVGQVTANGTYVGYTFDWYEGAVVAGVPVYTGPEFGELKVTPQQYTIRATDIITGCAAETQATVTNGTLPIPVPKIQILSHVTSCVELNGALSAYVGSNHNTTDYVFNWYDGTTETPPADNIGENYNNLGAGLYSVTATSIITGCKSPLETEEILILQQFADFDFIIQNSSCENNDGYASLVLIGDVPIERIEWSNDEGLLVTGPNLTDAFAGTYDVIATTFLGCVTSKTIEIKPDVRPRNGISRNNDGRNEFFQIDCIQNFPENVVQIFNRAGTMVYEAKGYDNSNITFDGRSNRGVSPMGLNLPDGTYFFIVDKRDGSKPVAGYLEIVK